ncbi:MAG: hypothetical protein AUK12_02855 [Candidatus Levybacteria bacterium CG2_30_37_29]|nr:MAG: hypothetical protein AUK12_02855 [Candidatus Levybacteria bacterium CG2_30_37_29]
MEPTPDELAEFAKKLNADGEVTVEKRQAWDLVDTYGHLQDLIDKDAPFGEGTIKLFQAMITNNNPKIESRYKGKYSYSRKKIVGGGNWECKPFAEPDTIDARMQRLAKQYESYMKFKPEDPELTYKVIEHAAEMMVDLIDIHPFSDGNGRTSRLMADGILISDGLYPMPHWLNPETEDSHIRRQQFGIMMEYACRGDFRLILRFMTQQQRLAIEQEFDAIEANTQATIEATTSGYRNERTLAYDNLTEYQLAISKSLLEKPPMILPLKKTAEES